MFPRLEHHISDDKQFAAKRFLVRNVRLELDKKLCRNCGVCLNSCPNDVITKGAPGASIKKPGKGKFMAGVVLSPGTCSYCGVCSYMCPYDALHLFIDGEQVPLDKLQLAVKGALPKLVAKEVTLKDGKKARQYMDGHLEYTQEACQSGCRTCIDVCPTGALSFQKKEGWEQEKFVIDKDKCIMCGSCAFSCPTGAIKIFREKITHEGKFNDPFWPNIVKKLMDYHGK
nr:4Fe-4S binding protein [Candidatus Sigynarchaeota archaeon]